MLTDLNETVELMHSKDYKERFIAEYAQLKIRVEKLRAFIIKIEVGQMDGLERFEPKHDCPLWLLQDQLVAMDSYKHILEQRAVMECIDLSNV